MTLPEEQLGKIKQFIGSVIAQNVPSLDSSDGERPPLWSANGESIYSVGTDGKLWHVDAASGRGTLAGDLPSHDLRILVAQPDRTTVWSNDREQTIWAIGRTGNGQEAGFYQIDLGTRTVRRRFAEKRVSTSFNVDVSSITGEIIFAARDQRHPTDLWRFDTRQANVTRVTHVNKHLDQYELGVTRLIEWNSSDGQTRRGALLLPPGYKEGQHLPLVLWLYGGSTGSANVNTFGLTGIGDRTFNMQVLATRGYAILFPDAPLRQGRAMSDVMAAVIPGLDAAIEQGYADPERLAIMGQSYGAHNVLLLITQTGRFKAAVISAAVTHPDLVAAYTEMGLDGSANAAGYYEHGQGGMGGTPWQYPERYRDNSPLFSFDRIDTPLLIGQGEKDGRLISSDAVFVGLQRLGKKVEYRIYQNEGHVISGKANLLDFWKRRIEFLDEYLNIARDDRGQMILQDGRAKGRGGAKDVLPRTP